MAVGAVAVTLLLGAAACSSHAKAVGQTDSSQPTPASSQLNVNVPAADLQVHVGALNRYLIAAPADAKVHAIKPGTHGTGQIAEDSGPDQGLTGEAVEWFTTATGHDIKIDISQFDTTVDAGETFAAEVVTDRQMSSFPLQQATGVGISGTFVDDAAPDYQVDAFAHDGDVVIEVMDFVKMDSTDNPTSTLANEILAEQYKKLVG